jgi:ElaB/YqjD/DUF883 family membrane-anchored ribosome-binding protein
VIAKTIDVEVPMATSSDDLEELRRLEKETEQLRNKQEERASAAASATEQDDARSLTVPIENIVGELEEIVRERPALALLAAFGIGMVVGKLLARR